MSKSKIDIGEVFVTAGINAKMDKSETFSREVVLSLHKFECCDWGDTSEDDALLIDRSVQDRRICRHPRKVVSCIAETRACQQIKSMSGSVRSFFCAIKKPGFIRENECPGFRL